MKSKCRDVAMYRRPPIEQYQDAWRKAERALAVKEGEFLPVWPSEPCVGVQEHLPIHDDVLIPQVNPPPQESD